MLSVQSSFDEQRFRRQVDSALLKVRQILDNTRHPVYASEVHHKYEDKFTLTEFLVKSALACDLQTLSALGVSSSVLETLVEWSKDKTVSLRIRAEEKCSFDREESRNVDSATKHVTSIGLGEHSGMISSKIVTTVTDYFWTFEAKYELIAFRGVCSDVGDEMPVFCRSCQHQIVTSTKLNPRTEHKIYPYIDVEISLILRNITANGTVAFTISRGNAKCRTPRRNPDVEMALSFHRALQQWCANVRQYFLRLFSVWTEHGLDLLSISAEGIFNPVLPLLEDHKLSSTVNSDVFASIEDKGTTVASQSQEGQSELKNPTLGLPDFNVFLSEQQRSLLERIETVAKTFPSTESGKLISGAEVRLLICLMHLEGVSRQLEDGVNYIEDMLRKQLFAAVGKVVTPADFSAYTRYHNRKLFRAEHEPRPFSYSVRRTVRHCPEGQVSIEERDSGSAAMFEPVHTVVCRAEAGATQDMEFSLNAATTVRFGGERFLHAWLRHSFSGQSATEIFLSAQARQFSSFIVLVGTIASATVFEPRYGMIVKNKDELRVPLILDTIPSPKEFRDAVESLSPEQRAFAKAFRGMQLASTLFGVCVIQIKPQLERLLNLPGESLTKEIKLTQDLTELFIKYQIPSDLLTSGTIGMGTGEGGAVEEVKGQVRAMQEMIAEARQKELKEQSETAAWSAMRRRSQPISPGSGSGSSEGEGCEGCDSDGDCDIAYAMRAEGCECECDDFCDEAPAFERSSSNREVDVAVCDGTLKFGDISTAEANKLTSPISETTMRPDSHAQGAGDAARAGAATVADYTMLPKELDRRFEALDPHGAVRPTTIRPGEQWTKHSVASLLAAEAKKEALGAEEQRAERGRAFELLDALTRGGALRLEEASLHVVLAATHVYDKGLVDTVVEDSVNPIDGVERSTLIMASAVLQRPAAALIRAEHVARARELTPQLFVTRS